MIDRSVRAILLALAFAAAGAAAGAAVATRQPAAAADANAAIDIDASRVEGRISPLLYGQFIEFMFEGVKRGLHAELLANRSFEEPPNAIGLSRDWNRYPDDRNDDYALTFAWDERDAYPTGSQRSHALRVELRPGVIERHGVYQPRVPIRQGVAYHGSVWMKTAASAASSGAPFSGTVTAALEADDVGGAVYAETHLALPTADVAANGEWTRVEFTLTPTATDPLARFAILFTGSGTLWLDQISLMPADAAAGGVRADVFAAVAALKPAFIRWPGGNVAQDYHWQWGIGPRDARPTWINLSWKNEPEPGDFGTDEFIAFARGVGADPSITVNVEGRDATAEEAAAWVEYCNGPASSRYGAMRARNGHPEPYRVKFWEIGNEIWGDWVRSHSDAATYARNLTRYVAAMRAVDPSIQVIAVGHNDAAWNRTVLQLALAAPDTRLDFLSVHHYYSRRDMQGDVRNLLARPAHYDRQYDDVAALLREFPEQRRPKLAINEWGLDLPETQQYSMLSALYAARLMHVFERRSDLIGMTSVSDLINGWPGGIIQASRRGLFVTPIYLVNQLYANAIDPIAGAERLAIHVDAPTVSSSREGDAPVLDAIATRSADGRSIVIKAVNIDLERAVHATIRIRGARVSPTATLERIAPSSLTAVNSFATPEAIRITRDNVPVSAGNTLSLDLPKHSVSVITLTTMK
jgi:alpha-L-arabinofuranosidase